MRKIQSTHHISATSYLLRAWYSFRLYLMSHRTKQKKCNDFLFPLAVEYQRTLPSAVEFVAMDADGDDLFVIQEDIDGNISDMCINCATTLNINNELFNEIKTQSVEFLKRHDLSEKRPNLNEVAAVETRMISSDTDHYGIARCLCCGEVLDLNSIIEDAEDDLRHCDNLESLKRENLRLFDLWLIYKILSATEHSKDKVSSRLVNRLISDNNLLQKRTDN